MTPAQLAELQAAWPGDWQKTEGHASVPKYELPVTSTGWTPGASVIPWSGAVVLQLRRDGQKTFAVTGATFKDAAKNLRAKLRKYAAGLHRLADEVPVPGTKTPREGRQVPPAEFLAPAGETPTDWATGAPPKDGQWYVVRQKRGVICAYWAEGQYRSDPATTVEIGPDDTHLPRPAETLRIEGF